MSGKGDGDEIVIDSSDDDEVLVVELPSPRRTGCRNQTSPRRDNRPVNQPQTPSCLAQSTVLSSPCMSPMSPWPSPTETPNKKTPITVEDQEKALAMLMKKRSRDALIERTSPQHQNRPALPKNAPCSVAPSSPCMSPMSPWPSPTETPNKKTPITVEDQEKALAMLMKKRSRDALIERTSPQHQNRPALPKNAPCSVAPPVAASGGSLRLNQNSAGVAASQSSAAVGKSGRVLSKKSFAVVAPASATISAAPKIAPPLRQPPSLKRIIHTSKRSGTSAPGSRPGSVFPVAANYQGSRMDNAPTNDVRKACSMPSFSFGMHAENKSGLASARRRSVSRAIGNQIGSAESMASLPTVHPQQPIVFLPSSSEDDSSTSSEDGSDSSSDSEDDRKPAAKVTGEKRSYDEATELDGKLIIEMLSDDDLDTGSRAPPKPAAWRAQRPFGQQLAKGTTLDDAISLCSSSSSDDEDEVEAWSASEAPRAAPRNAQAAYEMQEMKEREAVEKAMLLRKRCAHGPPEPLDDTPPLRIPNHWPSCSPISRQTMTAKELRRSKEMLNKAQNARMSPGRTLYAPSQMPSLPFRLTGVGRTARALDPSRGHTNARLPQRRPVPTTRQPQPPAALKGDDRGAPATNKKQLLAPKSIAPLKILLQFAVQGGGSHVADDSMPKKLPGLTNALENPPQPAVYLVNGHHNLPSLGSRWKDKVSNTASYVTAKNRPSDSSNERLSGNRGTVIAKEQVPYVAADVHPQHNSATGSKRETDKLAPCMKNISSDTWERALPRKETSSEVGRSMDEQSTEEICDIAGSVARKGSTVGEMSGQLRHMQAADPSRVVANGSGAAAASASPDDISGELRERISDELCGKDTVSEDLAPGSMQVEVSLKVPDFSATQCKVAAHIDESGEIICEKEIEDTNAERLEVRDFGVTNRLENGEAVRSEALKRSAVAGKGGQMPHKKADEPSRVVGNGSDAEASAGADAASGERRERISGKETGSDVLKPGSMQVEATDQEVTDFGAMPAKGATHIGESSEIFCEEAMMDTNNDERLAVVGLGIIAGLESGDAAGSIAPKRSAVGEMMFHGETRQMEAAEPPRVAENGSGAAASAIYDDASGEQGERNSDEWDSRKMGSEDQQPDSVQIEDLEVTDFSATTGDGVTHIGESGDKVCEEELVDTNAERLLAEREIGFIAGEEQEDVKQNTSINEEEEPYGGIAFDDDGIPDEHRQSAELATVKSDRHSAYEKELPPWLVCVNHLSQKSFEDRRVGGSIRKLPTLSMTVHGSDDDVLYDFKVYAAESSIPGAGLGAFMEFTGARKLDKESQERGEQINAERPKWHEPKTMQPLEAVFGEGESGVTVQLKGRNLHGNNNSVYWPTAALKTLTAKIPDPIVGCGVFRKKKETVRIVGEGVYDSLDFDALSISNAGALQSIGYRGIYTIADYRRADDISQFPDHLAKENTIHIGRYGPFQNADRKMEEIFSLKVFCFNQEPSEWSFGVDEPLFGSKQIIDITDDITGATHELAEKEIPMYVNEVGHGRLDKQNVFLMESNNRTVHYYVKLPKGLKKGERIELLTDYMDVYEWVRERKGYGLKNLRGVPSDDQCLASLLYRNFDDRQDACNIVDQCESIEKLFAILSYIHGKIWLPLSRLIDLFFNAPEGSEALPELSTNQWIAVRRIKWLVSVFRARLEKENLRSDEVEVDLLRHVYAHKINVILGSIESSCVSFNDVMILDPSLRTKSNHSIRDVMSCEVVEEICYGLNNKDGFLGAMPLVMDGSMYCPLTRRLITTLCDHAARILLFGETSASEEEEQAKRTLLLQNFLETALSAKEKIVKRIRDADKFEDLEFESGILRGSEFRGTLDDVWKRMKHSSSFFIDNRTTPKSFRSAILSKVLYSDALAAAFLEPVAGVVENIAVDSNDRFVMVHYDGLDGQEVLRELGSVPLSVKKISESVKLNETWYIQWQVVWTVDLFARYFLGDANIYSLEDLCTELEADLDLAKFVTMRGIQNDNEGYCSFWKRPSVRTLLKGETKRPRTESRVKSGKPKNHKKRDPAKRKLKSSNKSQRIPAILIYEGPPTGDFPGGGDWPEGWTLKTFRRASGESKGGTDCYWYAPPLLQGENPKRFRSRTEILRYLAMLI